ncbi:MAG: sn-glycerol-3-phosphate ABC transporter ATP-binding protein UgpC [Rhodobacteraceae bacterium]|nr:sn-glycerol-3-phosphate ABC transporter ATP-binding protein UgpC [Paracoccaceae bacterium]
MSGVSLREVKKSYNTLNVIPGVSVEIADGEFVALVGPSGCGKSTLLRMIAGLEEISGGTIAIGDRVVNNVESKDRNIAMVFQTYALYPHMTVAENMGFSLKLKGASKADIESKVARAAEILHLSELLGRYPRQLSGGQRQRVAMGRAIVRDPEVFLFDEPLSNLDAKLRVQMRAEIRQLHHRLKTTTIYVTHDQIEAMTMADRIVVLRNGRIEQAGSPLELYDTPANAFVGGFIGSPSMNQLPGTISAEGFAIDAGITLPLDVDVSSRIGRKAIYGIRPEHLQISKTGGLEARVSVCEPTGTETHIFVKLGDQDLLIVSRERLSLMPGDPIRISPDTAKAHLFDLETGVRIEADAAKR